MSSGELPVPLFTPLQIGEVRVRNRVVISPMQQYSARRDGQATEWHHTHLTRLALGGAGIVFTEALAVEERGRLTYSDLGAWSDGHVDGLTRLAQSISDHGAIPGAQLIHAGRKASVQ